MLLLLALLGPVAAKVFQATDIDQPGFDFTQLEVVERFKRPLGICKDIYDEGVVYRYNYWASDSTVASTNVTLMETQAREVVQVVETHSGETTEHVIHPRLDCLQQDHPEVISTIQSSILVPPGLGLHTGTVATLLGGQVDGPPTMLDQTYFHERLKGGFFVEAGAVNGIDSSNSLHYETQHQWTGLLIEPVPKLFRDLARSGRRAWSVQTCLSTKTRPETVNFSLYHANTEDSMEHGLNGIVEEGRNATGVRMQCLPLYSLLLALGNPRVDFLTLDIEGPEYQVLLTIPWDKVNIRAIAVETFYMLPQVREQTFALLTGVGYTHMGSLARDDLFVLLDDGEQSPRPSIQELLARRLPRECQYFRVKESSLESHCRHNWPRDFYTDRAASSLPPCLRGEQCAWTIDAVINTFFKISGVSYYWKQQLSDGCSYTLT